MALLSVQSIVFVSLVNGKHMGFHTAEERDLFIKLRGDYMSDIVGVILPLSHGSGETN